MRQICYIFLYLNIYASFLTLAQGQEIILTISTEISMPQNLEDSLGVVNKHQDFSSIKKETRKISRALEKYGYLESQAT